MAEGMKELLEQQRTFFIDVLGSQRSWMESQLELQKREYLKRESQLATALESTGTINSSFGVNSHIAVPAFTTFNHDKQQWESYIAQLTQHFTAYKVIDDDQKKAFFLSWVGGETFELLVKLFCSVDVQSKSYEELVAKLTSHFKTKVHVLASRYELFKLKMGPNQKYSEWLAELRGVARNCKYVCRNKECNKEFVDELIRDIIVLNTPHEAVRTAALQKLEPTLEDIILVAEAFEAAQTVKKQVSGENEVKTEVLQLKSTQARSQSNEAPYSSGQSQSCSGCGTHHSREKCKFRNAQCRKCKRFGHIAPVCNTGSKVNSPKQQYGRHQKQQKLKTNQNSVLTISQVNSCSNTVSKTNRKYMVEVRINGKPLQFQLDSGATCSIIGLEGYRQIHSPPLLPCNQGYVTTYGGGKVKILGSVNVTLQRGDIEKQVQVTVTNVERNGEILGTDLIEELGLCPCQAHVKAITLNTCEELIKKFPTVFNDSLGHCKSFEAHLQLKPNAVPKYFKARPLPFSQMEAFKREAQRLVDKGIWKPLHFSNWAAPIVVVPKTNGRIRICGIKALNAQLDVDQYPIPRVEELFQTLRGSKLFTKIDLSDAYFQVEMDEASKKLTVVNTPAGLFEYQRLPFGVASAPAIFQRLLEQIIVNIPRCVNYLDDIIIGGKSLDDLNENIEQVFSRLQQHGFTCQQSKCSFMQREVEYLGFIINSDGISPTSSKVAAINELPRPDNLKDLQAFLGKINYYSKFINNLAQTAAPLNNLRRMNETFKWGEEQEKSFTELKRQLSTAPLLSHFDDKLPIVLATDASSHGIGAVLSHRLHDGSEKPVAFASKTLDEHQKLYSQIEKEALSIIFGVKKFHQYLYGRTFTLLTDHKPLVTIFSPDKQLPVLTIQRLQRWALTLMAYRYEIKYRATDKHSNADALSRLPKGPDVDFDRANLCFQVDIDQQLDEFPLNASRLRKLTQRDVVLKKVSKFIEEGWPGKLSKADAALQPYFTRRFSLSIELGIVILQTNYSRVVVPESARTTVIDLLHEGHWGISRMKQMARRHCWWPKLDSDIEQRVSDCRPCQEHSATSPAQEFSCWPAAEGPWQRIHLDFAGPFLDSMWLLCVDAYSKFPFVVKMQHITATATIEALNSIFAVEGFPDTIVSDNGRQFTASTFQQFCTDRGIKHLTTAPFHPASNGEAERFVRTFKQSLKSDRWRASPNPTTGKSPAELLHGRQPRGLLTLLHPTSSNETSKASSSAH
ncbi:uncharacterized protein K02A2.6-like [Rhagoletis pomonella]|uniref:uncharacterized protein K02A2.6-like n=1 Tax=Rhagoletis pomonella TaxID=28610 RepID=UPI001780404C|nr:uncharacterized protein K02A2.6-like [Rhagoletis pomonella]